MTIIDLDQAATASVRRQVLEAMWPHLTGDYGNPSSTHALGRRAADALEDARARIARILGVRTAQIVFTSGGTEADNLGVIGLTLAAIAAGREPHIVVGAVEHEAVLAAADHLARWHGVEVARLGVDRYGRYSADELRALLRPGTALVAVQHANNEVGTVQPVDELVRAARAVGARVHVDAVQTAGWMPVVPAAPGGLSADPGSDSRPDAVAISGHKLGAPKGVGALILPTGVAIEPLIHGGGQERDRRSGTENVAGAVGLAVALELADAERRGSLVGAGLGESRADADAPDGAVAPAHADAPATAPLDPVAAVAARRDRFIADVLASVPGATLTGHPTDRLPAHASFVVPRVGGEPLLIALDERGILASSGSACAAGRDEPSPVLLAMGFTPDEARTAIRFTGGASTIQEEWTRAATELAASARSLGVS